MKICALNDKRCKPCEGGVRPLISREIKKLLSDIKDWKAQQNKKIERVFAFKDFKESMRFTNKVGEIAEEEGHHPDMLIHSWNKVKIVLWTHAIGGLSENDFIVANKIDDLHSRLW